MAGLFYVEYSESFAAGHWGVSLSMMNVSLSHMTSAGKPPAEQHYDITSVYTSPSSDSQPWLGTWTGFELISVADTSFRCD